MEIYRLIVMGSVFILGIVAIILCIKAGNNMARLMKEYRSSQSKSSTHSGGKR